MTSRRRTFRYASLLVLFALVSACAGADSSGPPVTVVTLASVTVSGNPSLLKGETAQLTATAIGSDGNAMSGRVFTWASSNSAVATVSDNGLVTALSAGTATITASTGGKTGSIDAVVIVQLSQTATVTVSGTATVDVGKTTQLTASAATSAGVAITGKTFTWSSANTAVATVASDGTVTGVSAGSAIISATVDGISGTRTVTVTTLASVVETVTVSGAGAVVAGSSITLSASAADASGAAITGKTFTWSTSNSAVATVNASGVVTGVAAGSAIISAAVDGKSGSKTVVVSALPPQPATITISGTLAVQAGTTSQLTAVVKDGSGNVIPNAVVSWGTTDAVNVPISPTGLVTAAHIANATITATSGAATTTAQFSSSLTPYTFSFPGNMTLAEQQMIKDNVQAAHALHKTAFNRQIQNATTISALPLNTGTCANGGAAAATTRASLIICFQNQGWTAPSPVLRQKIVQHELFHVWQWEAGWLNQNPALIGAYWIAEGSAELMGYRGMADRGLISISTGVGCNVKESSDFAQGHPPGLPALSSVETAQTFNSVQGPIYTTSMLGMDQLTSVNGLTSLKTYGDAVAAGTDWHTAFQTAFGTSTAAFYAQFPSYYSSLPVPATYQCGF